MKLVKLPQIVKTVGKCIQGKDIFINPECVVCIDPINPHLIGGFEECCSVLLHTQGEVTVSLSADDAATRLLDNSNLVNTVIDEWERARTMNLKDGDFPKGLRAALEDLLGAVVIREEG